MGAQVGPRGMAGLERGRAMGTHVPAHEGEWRAATGGGGPEPSQLGLFGSIVAPGDWCPWWHLRLWWQVLREMGVARGKVWAMGWS